jgi:hypothetical protein
MEHRLPQHMSAPPTGSEPRGASAPLSGPQPHQPLSQQCGLSPMCQHGDRALSCLGAPLPTPMHISHRRFAPRCTSPTVSSHPDDPSLTASSHPDDPSLTADPHPDAYRPPPLPTPMIHLSPPIRNPMIHLSPPLPTPMHIAHLLFPPRCTTPTASPHPDPHRPPSLPTPMIHLSPPLPTPSHTPKDVMNGKLWAARAASCPRRYGSARVVGAM